VLTTIQHTAIRAEKLLFFLGCIAEASIASSPGRFFANITVGEKYGLVLIVCGHVGCDRKFINSKTCHKVIVKFNENADK